MFIILFYVMLRNLIKVIQWPFYFWTLDVYKKKQWQFYICYQFSFYRIVHLK